MSSLVAASALKPRAGWRSPLGTGADLACTLGEHPRQGDPATSVAWAVGQLNNCESATPQNSRRRPSAWTSWGDLADPNRGASITKFGGPRERRSRSRAVLEGWLPLALEPGRWRDERRDHRGTGRGRDVLELDDARLRRLLLRGQVQLGDHPLRQASSAGLRVRESARSWSVWSASIEIPRPAARARGAAVVREPVRVR